MLFTLQQVLLMKVVSCTHLIIFENFESTSKMNSKNKVPAQQPILNEKIILQNLGFKI